jgi:hypothetical protein
MNVIWSPQAKKDYWQNIDYLEAEWSFQVTLNFIEKVEETIQLLTHKNVDFVSTHYKNVHKVVIIKHLTLLQNQFQSIRITSFLEYIPRFRKF